MALFLLFFAWYGSNTDGALWVDEAVNVATGSYYLKGELLLHHTHPPLGTTLFGLAYHLTGDTRWPRMVSALAAVATLAALYAFVSKRIGKAYGLGAMAQLGTAPLFARFAVQAMLESLLGLAAILSLLMLVKALADRPPGRGSMFALGLCLSSLVAIKYTGLLFAVPFLLLLFAGLKGKPSERLTRLAPAAGAFFLMMLLLYFPYARADPAAVLDRQRISISDDYLLSVTPGALKPIHTAALGAMPRLPAIVYMVYESAANHLYEFSTGHLVFVKDRTYAYPPWWSYLHWWETTFGWPAAILGMALLAAAALVKGWSPASPRGLLAIIAVPLLLLSILPLKSYFYPLPLLPLIICGGMLALHRISPFGRWTPVLLIALILIPPGGVWLIGKDISVDSGYDKAAAFVREWAPAHPGSAILAFHHLALWFYLGDEDWKSLSMYGRLPYTDEPLDKCPYIANGTYGLFIDREDQPRFASTATYRCSRELAKSRIDFGDGLIGLVYTEE